jgi:N-acyl-D-aspartate/D-glutamate deacylase
MAQFDTVILNGTIVDGTRSPRFRGSIGIKDGRVEEVIRGELDPSAADRVLDATGMIVAPGFVDLHTHYDAQIQWDPYATLSGWHGVTSLVLGNCGFGFAPVRPEERDRAMLSMSRVEAIPFDAMKEGMLWDWVTFPEWLETLDRIPKGVNVLSYVPVGPLMIWVMGLEEAKRRKPTEAETKEMCRLMEISLDAGACGWSVQRLGDSFMSVQRDFDGTPMVTDCMDDELCLAFADVLKRRGSDGHIQITQAKEDIREDMKFVEKLAEASGCPVLYNAIFANNYYPVQHRRMIEWVNECQSRGNQVWGQLLTAGNELTYTFEDFNLLDGTDCWREVTLGTVEERKAKMQLPENREALRHDFPRTRSTRGSTCANSRR